MICLQRVNVEILLMSFDEQVELNIKQDTDHTGSDGIGIDASSGTAVEMCSTGSSP